MQKTILNYLLLFFISSSLVFGQGKKEKVKLQLTLRDGNLVKGMCELSALSLQTDFGKLEIPLKNVTAVEMGVLPDPSKVAKVTTLLQQLSVPMEEMRKAAYEEVVKMDITVVPILMRYFESPQYQGADTFSEYTVSQALDELKATYNLDENFSEKDVVTIDGIYSIAGEYALKEMSLQTDYGVLKIEKYNIQRMEVLYVPSADEAAHSFRLNASKYISGNNNGGWLKTGISVKKGQKLLITASGSVTLASLSGNTYKPDGSSSSSSGYVSNGTNDYPTYGNVVFKLGEEGPMHRAGAKFNGAAEESGVLYLSIYESVYNSSNTGSYSVNVKLQ